MDIDTPEGRREMALSVLRDHPEGLTWQSGSFLGQISACPDRPLSEKQAAWFGRIVERAGLAPKGGA
jgi:hypothetical protein